MEFQKGQFGRYKRGDDSGYGHYERDLGDGTHAVSVPHIHGGFIVADIFQPGTFLPDGCTFKTWAAFMMGQMGCICKISLSGGHAFINFTYEPRTAHETGECFDEPNQQYTRADLFPEPEPDYASYEGQFCKLWYKGNGSEPPDNEALFGTILKYDPTQNFPFKTTAGCLAEFARPYTMPQPLGESED